VSVQEPLSLPATLLDAAKALQAAAVGGATYTPGRLRLGAEKIDLAHFPQVDKAKVQDWPLTSVALGQASIYGPPEQGVVLTGAAQVNQVLALLKGKEEVFFAQTDVVFRQGSDYYWVAYIVMVP